MVKEHTNKTGNTFHIKTLSSSIKRKKKDKEESRKPSRSGKQDPPSTAMTGILFPSSTTLLYHVNDPTMMSHV